MMTKLPLIFATNNAHKAKEIQSLLPPFIQIQTLQEAGILIDIPEPHFTIEANAHEKSSAIYSLTGKPCFGEDTGLEIEALNGAPGVHTARYAGNHGNAEANMKKVLHEMHNQINRNAQFKTVISLILQGTHHTFTGICPGSIAIDARGDNGFGYDPIFIPKGDERTFAEMELHEKNTFSHRKKATEQLIQFLQQHVTYQTPFSK